MYTVEVDYAPAYELAISLQAYLCRPVHGTIEQGPAWADRVRQQLTPEFAARLAANGPGLMAFPFDLLIWQCPAPRDCQSFLQWLGALPVDELAACVGRFQPAGASTSTRVLGARRDDYVELLSAWHAQYFHAQEPALAAGLAAQAEQWREQCRTLPSVLAVEEATNGILQEPEAGLERVVLVPQHHFRPWSFQGKYQGLCFYLYPADVQPLPPDSPAPALLRLMRALSDENRLRMLRFLAAGRRSFTDIVRFTGLAKSTVHHHLAALRAAGLVRVHGGGVDADGYSLRPGALERVSAALGAFLPGDEV